MMRIKVVVNPGAGRPEPVLSTLNDAFGSAGIDWDIAITHGEGDGYRAARDAVGEGFDIVGAYGGDGTVSEVAAALALGGTPMAILPGGTGNALAEDLGIPQSLAESTALVAKGEYELRSIDMARLGEGSFVLRATVGLEAETVLSASPELKERFGWLAYVISGLQTLADPPRATYAIEVDGESLEVEGVACIVANSATLGSVGVKMLPHVDVSDGLLDVIVVQRVDLLGLAGSAVDALTGEEMRAVTHRRGLRVRVESQPPLPVMADGEPAGTTPLEAVVMQAALRVVVPKPA
jgi:YegS/Rv2252/BmrU family lipid kinase